MLKNLTGLPKNYTYFFCEMKEFKDLINEHEINKKELFNIKGKEFIIVGINTYELLSSCDIVTYSEENLEEAVKDSIYGVSMFREGSLTYYTKVNKRDLKFAFFEDVILYTSEKSVRCHSKQMQLDLDNLIKVVDVYAE